MADKIISKIKTGTSDDNSYLIRAGFLYYGVTAGTAAAVTVTITDNNNKTIAIPSYYKGLTLLLKMTKAPSSGATLNVNGLGAKSIKYRNSITGSYFTAGAIYEFVYDGTDFVAIHSYDSNTTYSSGTGVSISGTTINHSNSITAGTASGSATGTVNFGGTISIPSITYDAQGHITGKSTATVTLPANPNTDTKVTQTTRGTATDFTAWRGLLWEGTDSGSSGATTFTGATNMSTNIICQPSSGTIKSTIHEATSEVVVGSSHIKYNTLTGCLEIIS